MKKNKTRITFKIIGILLLLLFLIITFIYYQNKVAPFYGTEFSKEEWDTALKSTTDQEYIEKELVCKRGAMVSDLKKKYLKIGTYLSEVKELLGYSKLYNNINSEQCLKYELGSCTGVLMSYHYLVICFDNNTAISSVTIEYRD